MLANATAVGVINHQPTGKTANYQYWNQGYRYRKPESYSFASSMYNVKIKTMERLYTIVVDNAEVHLGVTEEELAIARNAHAVTVLSSGMHPKYPE